MNKIQTLTKFFTSIENHQENQKGKNRISENHLRTEKEEKKNEYNFFH